jgi:hypothetical protein
MKKWTFLALGLCIIISSCSQKTYVGTTTNGKTWDVYTHQVDLENRHNRLPIQFREEGTLTFDYDFNSAGRKTKVDEEGTVIYKMPSQKTFEIPAGTPLTLHHIDKRNDGRWIYWMEADTSDPRLVPFWTSGQDSESEFHVRIINATEARKTGIGKVILSDGFTYAFVRRGQRLLYSWIIEPGKNGKVIAKGSYVPGAGAKSPLYSDPVPAKKSKSKKPVSMTEDEE